MKKWFITKYEIVQYRRVIKSDYHIISTYLYKDIYVYILWLKIKVDTIKTSDDIFDYEVFMNFYNKLTDEERIKYTINI